MKNTSVSSFNFMMLLGVLLFLNTNTVKASADSLFVVSGNLGGVGIGLEADSVYTQITQIVPNRPAYRSGQLKVGDRIIGVGQGASGEIIDIKGKTLEEVGDMIRGRVGTKVRLAILPADNIKSDPPLIVELVRESIQQFINISNADTWYFKPGDNITWAEPDYDDSNWHPISPGGLAIDAMPDSLWNGYGWWRLTFTADSSFYSQNWTMYYSGWGAAEVYLDGHLVHSFGNFSTDPDKERTFSPRVAVFPPINITEKETHTLAIRYSHHQAKSYNSIIKVFAENLGFGFGFGTHALNQDRAQLITYLSFSLFISAAVLFVLLLLHFMLFYKFPEDRSNLFISVLLGLLLISAVTSYNFIYLDATNYWSSILIWIFQISTSFAILFLPYVIAEIFKLEKQKKVVWLVAALPLIFVSVYLLNETLGYYIVLLILSISLFLIGYICWKAYKSGKRGVGYVAFGALGTLSFVIITISGILGQSVQVQSVTVAFIYTLFPLGMTLYVANGYGYLFTSLENEITDRTQKLNQSLEDLKNTQSQLVQQEKLASLGQLTAGIAHEIKNPLNFVNNFSEVSDEMIVELKEAMRRGDLEEADEIATDIGSNLKKIHEHGSRADGIVKSMLQHSRGGDGKMEPTPLNPLIKEYVNLAFHGMRAGNDPINVDIDLQLDENVGEVPLIAEDFSRVILNLTNNAFDACAERSRSAMRSKLTGDGRPETGGEVTEDGGRMTGNPNDQAPNSKRYSPKLTVRTISENGSVTIEIEDNGPGIPEEIKDKILQPFFTTKKGTAGTGLGLSITNDIIKAHGGSLDIESSDKGSIFNIHIPK